MANAGPFAELIDAAEDIFCFSTRTFRGWEEPYWTTPAEHLARRQAGDEERLPLLDNFRQAFDAAKSVPVLNYVSFPDLREHLWRIERLTWDLAGANRGWATERAVWLSQEQRNIGEETAALLWFDQLTGDFQNELDWWEDLSKQLAARNTQKPEQPDGEPAGEGGPKRTSANARMLEAAARDPDAMAWTARQWAKHLKCSPSSVHGTEAWKTFAKYRDMAAAEHRADRHRNRRVDMG